MQSSESTRVRRIGTPHGRGCPPALEIDLVHADDLGPHVDWPTGPAGRTTRTNGSSGTSDVTALTTGRAIHLLDVVVDHLRTSLETNADPDVSAALERAIADASSARETLTEIS